MNNELNKSGFLLVDKPIGITSHDVIHKLRRITNIKKIGHAGTLDPFASGLLIVAIGREATKKINTFVKLDKIYLAEIELGSTTNTHDSEGELKKISNKIISLAIIEKMLINFIGKQKQIPPMFSAKKIKGKKLYELARAGISVERTPCEIEIFDLKIINYNWPILEIKIHCSSGTYIRAIARDLGESLECGAYLKNLKRIAISQFLLENAYSLDKINQKNLENFLF